MERLPCSVCGRESGRLNERELCPCCDELVEIARRNLEAAAKSTLPPPKRIPKCSDCGGPQKPVLFRIEGGWTFYCVSGCHYCRECQTIHKAGTICPALVDGRRKAATPQRDKRQFVN